MTASATSFRDPGGVCCRLGGRVLRFMSSQRVADFEAFLKSSVARDFAARRQLASTWRLSETEAAILRRTPTLQPLFTANGSEAVFEHERIFFPSYPYEWPPEMLREAGRLTLELARQALADGYGLKDATPYNVLFRGSEAVFIDLLSFERRLPDDPVWRPYAQFVRTFILPLVANRHWGLRLVDLFAARRDGLEPGEIYRLCSPLKRLSSPIFSLVSAPTWLTAVARSPDSGLFRQRRLADAEKAAYILDSHLKQLGRTLDALKPPVRNASVWSDYMEVHTYSSEAFAAKERFIGSMLHEFKPSRVLDVGANTGHFSVLAAREGAQVVAIDSDPSCVGAIYQLAHKKQFNILPLVVDLARPSPAVGWRNRECSSFLDRTKESFDCVLILAVIHHLLITERIPLEEIISLAAELTTSLLIIEYVGPEDEMFRQLTRGREALHANLNELAFEETCAEQFEVLRSMKLPGTQRKLYALTRKGGGA